MGKGALRKQGVFLWKKVGRYDIIEDKHYMGVNKMSVSIGDNNKIKNTTIGENVTINNPQKKERFNEKHPYITGIVISMIAGIVLMFSFWNQIVQFIEGWF